MTSRTGASLGTVRPDPRRRSFAQVAEDLVRDTSVTDRAFRLWCLLDRIARGMEQALGSRTDLAKALGCSTDSVDRAVRCLLASGWLLVEHQPGAPSRYTVLDDPIPPAPEPTGGAVDNPAVDGGTLRTGADTPNGGTLRTGADTPSAPVRRVPGAHIRNARARIVRERKPSFLSVDGATPVDNPPSVEREGGKDPSGGDHAQADASTVLAACTTAGWTLTATDRRRLTAPITDAIRRHGVDAVTAELATNPGAAASAYAVLAARLITLDNTPSVAAEPRKATRPAWCGACDERTRLVDVTGPDSRDAAAPCPTCHPSRALTATHHGGAA